MNLSHMTKTVSALAECSIAVLTFVRFLFGMNPKMLFEGASVAEFAIAKAANEWLLAGMDSLVGCK